VALRSSGRPMVRPTMAWRASAQVRRGLLRPPVVRLANGPPASRLLLSPVRLAASGALGTPVVGMLRCYTGQGNTRLSARSVAVPGPWLIPPAGPARVRSLRYTGRVRCRAIDVIDALLTHSRGCQPWQIQYDRPMKMPSAPEAAWRCGLISPIWSGFRKGATAHPRQARTNATVVPASGFALVQHCTRPG
jgi:hypothetical protein